MSIKVDKTNIMVLVEVIEDHRQDDQLQEDKDSNASSCSTMSMNNKEKEHYDVMKEHITKTLEQCNGPIVLEEEEFLSDIEEEEGGLEDKVKEESRVSKEVNEQKGENKKQRR